ncbi:hypothetical protein Daus18300_004791 [Diaporthe australafricana]|uniref:Ecp2 effector protein domain-containing protein n=1 Tax=Diaporthe australafricana TaxID=127596 RepID=A0ABR3X6P0_9PEZI
MKVSPIFTTSMLAFAGSIQASNGMDLETRAVEPAYCTWEFMDLGAYWLIRAKGAENIGTICHHFWNGLKQFGAACMVHRPNSCGPGKHNETDLDLRFKTSHACQVGMVHSAFWEGTENKYGSISCIQKDNRDHPPAAE